jgi:hypothetical protein
MPSRRAERPHHVRRGIAAPSIASGLLLLLFGALVEIGHHAGVPGFSAEVLGDTGHLVTLAGMVLTAVGVMLAAALRRR